MKTNETAPSALNSGFELNVFPPNYSKLNSELPDSFPQPNVSCGIRTAAGSGLVISWIVDPRSAMKYDDLPGLIDSLHRDLDDNFGIIEANNGYTAKSGYRYIYNILKMRFAHPDLPVPEVHYILNMNVNIKGTDYYINTDYREEGTTGMRDSAVFSALMNKGTITGPEEWRKDPYDKNHTRGFLMNLSERPEYDKLFPDHPLSVLREYVRWVTTNN